MRTDSPVCHQRYTAEFKDEAVRQVTEKGHSVQEVAARLGVSSHSLYKWVKAVLRRRRYKSATAWFPFFCGGWRPHSIEMDRIIRRAMAMPKHVLEH